VIGFCVSVPWASEAEDGSMSAGAIFACYNVVYYHQKQEQALSM
jgi:hypothetical protein